MTAADLLKLTDEPLSIDKLRQGTVIMINTDDFGSINLRIKKRQNRMYSVPTRYSARAW